MKLLFVSSSNHICFRQRSLPRRGQTLRGRRFTTSASISRRAFLTIPLFHLFPDTCLGMSGLPLVQDVSLSNTYYLMRACQSITNAKHITSSNPADKLLLRKHGLTPLGRQQALVVAEALQAAGVGSSAWIWPSVTISAFETAELIAYQLAIRREQIVPEFSFLDARGVGALDGSKDEDVARLVWAADEQNSAWRPKAGEDGTPNECLEDVFVRVRQLLAKTETQYSGEDILVVASDSDCVSVLQAAMTGMPLGKCHTVEFKPGEVRKVGKDVEVIWRSR